MIDHTKTIEALTLELDKAGEWEHKARDLARQTISESDTLWTADKWHKKMLEAWHGEGQVERTAKALQKAESFIDRLLLVGAWDRQLGEEASLLCNEALSTITTGEDNDRT